jgi:hypothetical protein
MTEEELSAALIYYYERAEYLAQVTTMLFVVVGVLALLLVLFIALFAHAQRERGWLQEELARQTDPDRQLMLIHELGEAGRREVRRLASEAQEAMLVAGGYR